MIEVTLTPLELEMVRLVAASRYDDSRQLGVDDKHGCARGREPDFIGCCGEMAYAKAANRYWTGGSRSWQDGDVGNVQVRTTATGRCLLVRPADVEKHPGAAFVLVVGEAPTFRVIGWLRGRECARDEWMRAPNGRPPAYFVPQSALRAA